MGDSASDGGGTGKLNREDLDARAAELGIENPQSLKNIEAVEEVISDAEQNPRYSREQVLASARTITGYSSHLLAGALHGSDQESFTKEQATALAKRFAKRDVEVRD